MLTSANKILNINKFDCWIYIIKNMEKLKEMPFVDKNPVFRMLAEIGDLRKLTPEERELYDEDIKVMRDLYATQKWEEEQKRMEIEKGRAEGREQGRAEVKSKLPRIFLPWVYLWIRLFRLRG